MTRHPTGPAGPRGSSTGDGAEAPAPPAQQPGSPSTSPSPSLVQQALGPAWAQLPPALQAHHGGGPRVEHGQLDVDFPAGLGPLLRLVSALGALVHRRGRGVATHVSRTETGAGLHWQRRLRYANGTVLRFSSVWAAAGPGQLVEWVNPWLGLQLQPYVHGQQLRFRGVCLVLRLAGRGLCLPEWLALGHATIHEQAVDGDHVAMDFRLTHPLFGQVFRYAGRFRVDHRVDAGLHGPMEPAD